MGEVQWSKRKRALLNEYIRDVFDLIGLRDWTIELLDEEPQTDPGIAAMGFSAHASCDMVRGRKYACIRLSQDFFEWNEYTQRHAITHEAIHCHFAALTEQARMDLLAHLGQQAYDILWASFLRNLEFGVDGLADVLAPKMPKPPSL